MKINLSAPVMWIFLTCVGYLIFGAFTGAVVGLALGTGLTMLADIL